MADGVGSLAGHQRATGVVRVGFKRRGPATVLDGLRQEGCLKARFPRVEPGAAPEVVLLNNSGGVAGGDRLRTEVCAGVGTRVVVASQAAERFYRALPGSVAAVGNRVVVADGAALDWLPQETILFNGSALRRRLEVELAADAEFVGVESLVFGRAAMGEVVERAELDDVIAVRRGKRLLLHDRIRLSGRVADKLALPAVAGGAGALATVTVVAPGCEGLLDGVRAALEGVEAGASAWDGVLVARILAANGACLRRAVVAALGVMRAGRALPRVWLC